MGRLIGLFLLVLVLIARSAAAGDVVVFAAASLTDALGELAKTWDARGGDRMVVSAGASSDLARQIRAGAPADAFFSSDAKLVEQLDAEGFVAAGTRQNVLSNVLVIVEPGGRPHAVKTPADLKQRKHLALADPETVPAGVYGRKWLEGLGLWEALREKVVPAVDVRAALAAVESGHADAGIVYRTDGRASKRVRVAFEVPREQGPPILYAVAAIKERLAGPDIVRFLVSPEAQRVYERHGFLLVDR